MRMPSGGRDWLILIASAWPLAVLILYLAFNAEYFASMLQIFAPYLAHL